MKSLVLGILASVLWVSAALAQPAELTQANARLVAAIRAGQADGRGPPRLSDPAGAQLIRAAFDVSVIPAHFDEISSALAFCDTAGEARNAYLFFGLPTGADGAFQGAMTPEVVRRLNANMVEYQDELTVALLFGARCTARMNRSFAGWFDGIPPESVNAAQRQGAAMVRMGSLNILQGALIMAGEDHTRDANVELLLEELVASADDFIAFLQPVQRQLLITQIGSMSGARLSAREQAAIQALRSALDRSDCSGVCAI